MTEELDPYWDTNTSFPVPKDGMPKCAICGGETIIRGWLHHCKPKSPSMYRIDVGMKCTNCAHVWYHGVRAKKEHFQGHGTQYNRRKDKIYVHAIQDPQGITNT